MGCRKKIDETVSLLLNEIPERRFLLDEIDVRAETGRDSPKILSFRCGLFVRGRFLRAYRKLSGSLTSHRVDSKRKYLVLA